MALTLAFGGKFSSLKTNTSCLVKEQTVRHETHSRSYWDHSNDDGDQHQQTAATSMTQLDGSVQYFISIEWNSPTHSISEVLKTKVIASSSSAFPSLFSQVNYLSIQFTIHTFKFCLNFRNTWTGNNMRNDAFQTSQYLTKSCNNKRRWTINQLWSRRQKQQSWWNCGLAFEVPPNQPSMSVSWKQPKR